MSGVVVLGLGNVEIVSWFVQEIGDAGVADYTDYCHEGAFFVFVAELVTYGILIRPDSFGHGLVDYGDGLRGIGVGVGEGTAGDYGHAHGGEVIWIDDVVAAGRGAIGLIQDLALEVDRAALAVVTERDGVGDGG